MRTHAQIPSFEDRRPVPSFEDRLSPYHQGSGPDFNGKVFMTGTAQDEDDMHGHPIMEKSKLNSQDLQRSSRAKSRSLLELSKRHPEFMSPANQERIKKGTDTKGILRNVYVHFVSNTVLRCRSG